MKQYATLMEVNRKQIMSEKISTDEMKETVDIFLDDVRSEAEILTFKKRMKVNPETDRIYPSYFLPPYHEKKKQRLVQGYLPKTNILYSNHYELEIIRLLHILEPENEIIKRMVDHTLQRVTDTCFGNSCMKGECVVTGISVLRFLAVAQSNDQDWIGRILESLGELFMSFGKGQAAVQKEIPVSYLLMAFADIDNDRTRELISVKKDWLLNLLRKPWITGTLSNGRISEMDTYNLMYKYIIRNALETLPEYKDISKCKIYVNSSDSRCYCDI